MLITEVNSTSLQLVKYGEIICLNEQLRWEMPGLVFNGPTVDNAHDCFAIFSWFCRVLEFPNANFQLIIISLNYNKLFFFQNWHKRDELVA